MADGTRKRGPKKCEKSRYNGHYCCAVGCHNQEGTENIKFFKVIRKKNPDQTEKWIQAIKRKERDGTLWRPTAASKLCGTHFKSGQFSREVNDPDYVPSLFLTGHVKPKTENDVARAKRVGTTLIFIIKVICLKIRY